MNLYNIFFKHNTPMKINSFKYIFKLLQIIFYFEIQLVAKINIYIQKLFLSDKHGGSLVILAQKKSNYRKKI